MIISKARVPHHHIVASSVSLICIGLLLFSCNGKSQQQPAPGNDSGIIALPSPAAVSASEMSLYKSVCESWYNAALRNSGFNGGILVAKKGNIVYENYAGTGHLRGTDTVTKTTPFHIASVSKTFTAMAVLKLWQEHRFSLDDEFSKYFPQFNYPGVTIRSLLNHRSGLPNYVYFMETLGWDKNKFVTNEDVLNALINRKADIKNIAPPNTHFTYCNTNYALLALLLEKLSGQKYPALLQQMFFKPLQMQHSFVFDTTMIGKVNPSYDWRGTEIAFSYLDAVYGDKNIYTTPEDLLQWDRALYSKQVFADSTLAEAFAPYSNERAGVRNYGLGWRMNVYPDGKKVIYHNGWWHGNNASFIRLIQDSATIIVLGNRFNRNIYHAKDMAAAFGLYSASGEEEEESANRKDSTAAAQQATPVKAVVPKKAVRVKKAKAKTKPAPKKATHKKRR